MERLFKKRPLLAYEPKDQWGNWRFCERHKCPSERPTLQSTIEARAALEVAFGMTEIRGRVVGGEQPIRPQRRRFQA
jgi:hypothetical protein